MAHPTTPPKKMAQRLARFCFEQEGIISPKLHLLSSHAEEKSLAIYRDLALTDVSAEYEEVMRSSLSDERKLYCVPSQLPSRYPR